MHTLAATLKSWVLATAILFTLSSCGQQPPKGKEPTTTTTATAVKKVTIPIDGMACASCQGNVRKNLKSINGVTDVQVSLEHRNAMVTFDSLLVNTHQLVDKINKIGYKAGKPKSEKL